MKTIYNEKKFNDFREIINNSAEKFAERTAFLLKNKEGQYENVSYSDFKNRFYRLCEKFCDFGLKGKRIAIIGRNSFDWVLSYLAASTVGIAVPIDKEVSTEDMLNFIDAANCSAVCMDDKLIEKLQGIPENVSLFPFTEINKLARALTAYNAEKVDSIKIDKYEMKVLIFTSGTTGHSKGVCLSQYNICSDIHSTVSVVKIKKTDVTLSILPIHHTYECTLNCLLLLSRGACITYCEGLSKIKTNILEYSPSVLVVVPLLLKNLNKQIRRAIAKSCPKKYAADFETKPLSEALAATPLLIRKVIITQVRKSLGGKLRLFIVGAADLDSTLVYDFAALGIRTLQGYGLTECSPLLAGNNDFFMDESSTGNAMPGVSLRIDNPNSEGVGEILARGENIMLGYYNDEEATDAVFKYGWFRTGDLGYIDDKGALFIRGRCKNVIVTENGKNIYPEELETRLAQCPEISEALVVADNSEGSVRIKAKVLPNFDYIKEKTGMVPEKEELCALMQSVIHDINEKLPAYKKIKAIEVLSKALEKTTTQKIKRYGDNSK